MACPLLCTVIDKGCSALENPIIEKAQAQKRRWPGARNSLERTTKPQSTGGGPESRTCSRKHQQLLGNRL